MNRKHNRLLALQAENKAAPRAYRIEAADKEATIYLYDVIGYDWWTGGGITALQFAADLNALKGVATLHVRFNSPGGDVFDGRAICAALDAHPAHKVGHVDGWAASAASFILMHCDEVEITQGAMIMIHNGWTFAAGDNRIMSETANLLLKIDGSIQDDYMRHVNVARDQIVDWMNAETWFTAEEAVKHGFADRVATSGDGAKARASWNVAAYDHAPTPETPAPAAVEEPVPEPEQSEPDPNSVAEADHAHRMRSVALLEGRQQNRA